MVIIKESQIHELLMTNVTDLEFGARIFFHSYLCMEDGLCKAHAHFCNVANSWAEWRRIGRVRHLSLKPQILVVNNTLYAPCTSVLNSLAKGYLSWLFFM